MYCLCVTIFSMLGEYHEGGRRGVWGVYQRGRGWFKFVLDVDRFITKHNQVGLSDNTLTHYFERLSTIALSDLIKPTSKRCSE